VVVPVQLMVEQCALNALHIGDITLTLSLDPYGRTLARWQILAHDQDHNPKGLVTVDASIWSPSGGPYQRSRITKANGWARFHWGSRMWGEIRLCVDNLTLAGYTYMPDANDVPSCAP
jgi:hypothetical protein